MPFLMFLLLAAIFLACWIFGLFTEKLLIPFVVALVALFLIGGFLFNDFHEEETRTIFVKDKDRGGDDGSYRIYTNGPTLGLKDILFDVNNARLDTADVFGDIEVGNCYNVTTIGWEFGGFSLMPNIADITDLGVASASEECGNTLD